MRWRRLTPMLALLLVAASCGDGAGSPDAPTTLDISTEPTPTSTTLGSPTSSALPTTTTSAPRLGPGNGGVVVIGDDQEPPTLNPYAEGGDNFIVWVVGQALHTGVWDIDAATLERIPEVVVELPSVANGGVVVNANGTMTVHYRIRDEAVWADGTPISGDDFAFTYETLTDPAISEVQFGISEGYGLIDPASIEIGVKTFAYTMTQPSLTHEELFRWLIPRHQVEGSDVLNDWNDSPWLSGGPFVLDTWDRGGSDGVATSFGRLTLVRNDNYWKTDAATGDPLPYLDGVVFEFIPEAEQILSAFAARELDVINPPPWAPEIERLLGDAIDEGATVTIENGLVWEHLNFQFGTLNRNADSLNRHVDFRRAVAHALDREGLVEMAQDGYGQPLASYLDVFIPELSTGAWDRYDYDPALARELLAGLCEELGRDCSADPPTLVFSTTSNADLRPRIADWLVASLGEVGISVILELEDSQLFFGETLDKGDWDVGLWAWVGSPGYESAVAIHDIFDPGAPPPSGMNFYRWGTPAVQGEPLQEGGPGDDFDVNQGPSTVIDDSTQRFAEIVDEMAITIDERVLQALLLEAEEILADQVVVIPLFSRFSATAFWPDEIAGFQSNLSLAGHTWNIEQWYRVDR